MGWRRWTLTPKYLLLNRLHIFQDIFWGNFKGYQRVPLEFYTKCLTEHWKIRFLYNVENFRALKLMSIESSSSAEWLSLENVPSNTISVRTWLKEVLKCLGLDHQRKICWNILIQILKYLNKDVSEHRQVNCSYHSLSNLTTKSPKPHITGTL